MSEMYVCDKELWQRPITTKRYLHPPFAEEMATMWVQNMWLLGDIYENNDLNYPAAAAWLLHGEEEVFPYKEVVYDVREDGAPVHALSYDMGEWELSAESFCDIAVSPTVYTKVRLKNKVLWQVQDTLGMIVRTGKETWLHCMPDPDGYMSFYPNIRLWGNIPRTWKNDGNMLTDGKYTICISKDDRINMHWQGEEKGLPWYRRGTLKMDFALEAGEECEFVFAFHKEIPGGSLCDKASLEVYEAEKEKVLAFWTGELAKIKVYPGGEAYKPLIRSIVAQCLQMFCHHVGKYDYVLPRQGGTQRNIWVGEAYQMLMGMDRIGDFFSYTERAYDLFFDTLYEKEGENKGALKTLNGSIPWGGITGAGLKGLAFHLIRRGDKAAFDKYKERMYESFCWIQKMRYSDRPEGCFAGIMPPMQACDWPTVVQNWTKTDMWMLEGYEELVNCFGYFGDERAKEIKAAFDEYKSIMREMVAQVESTLEDPDEMMLCGVAGELLTDPTTDTVCVGDDVRFAVQGIIAHDGEEMRKIKNYYKNRGMTENGLYGMMHATAGTNVAWLGYVRYTSTASLRWVLHYLAIGDREKAWEVIKGELKFGMTKEYYMLERYASNDPYFVPWLPNASANGRLLTMLCEYFGV